ncbi:MAG: Ig-like domain-containing protein [Tardiphaga sp.]
MALKWSTQMTHVIRACSVLMMAALALVVAAPAFAQNAPQCVVSGSPPAGWGFNSIGYIEIASGGSCMFSVNIGGEILGSSVSQNPAHGTLQQLDVSSFVYTSEAGYRGRDTFSVQATGKSPTSSGTSVITISATLQ